MGFATVIGTIAFIFIFITGVTYFAYMQRNISQSANAEHDQRQMQAKNANTEISITATDYNWGMLITWKDDLYAEFLQGTTDNATVNGTGSVHLSGAPYATGSYTSQIIDTGFAGTNYTTLSWTSIEPANTALYYQIRSGASVVAIQAAQYTGPDGTINTHYSTSGLSINETNDANRYIQYRVVLETNNSAVTPTIQDIRIGMQRASGIIHINVSNTGSEKLRWNETDVYIAGTRIERNISKRVFIMEDNAGQALWDPGEYLQIYAFSTITSTQELAVANRAARDGAAVTP